MDTKKKQFNFLIFSGIGIIFVMGMRFPKYEIVYDLNLYYHYYKNIANTSWVDIFNISRFEPGYAILNKLLSSIVPWPQFIIIFEAVFCVFCVSYFIYKNSDYPFECIIYYVTLGTMSFQLTAFRQSFAISVCLLSVELIKKKKIVPFLLTMLLAWSFHQTAIVFIFAYFFINRPLTLKQKAISIAAIVLLSLNAEHLIKLGNELFDMNYSQYIGNRFGGLVPITIYTIILLLAYVKNENHKFSLGTNMTAVGLAIYLTRYKVLAMERVSFFFTPGSIVALPEVVRSFKDKRTAQIINCTAIILALALFIYRLTYAEYADYRFFWQN